MNSGSRDAGRDPMWDFRTGQRVQDEAYVELFRRDGGPEEIDHGDRFLAVGFTTIFEYLGRGNAGVTSCRSWCHTVNTGIHGDACLVRLN